MSCHCISNPEDGLRSRTDHFTTQTGSCRGGARGGATASLCSPSCLFGGLHLGLSEFVLRTYYLYILLLLLIGVRLSARSTLAVNTFEKPQGLPRLYWGAVRVFDECVLPHSHDRDRGLHVSPVWVIYPSRWNSAVSTKTRRKSTSLRHKLNKRNTNDSPRGTCCV